MNTRKALVSWAFIATLLLGAGCVTASGDSAGTNRPSETGIGDSLPLPTVTGPPVIGDSLPPSSSSTVTTTAVPTNAVPETKSPAPLPAAVSTSRPAWLGTRPLPLRPDGFGEVQPTPPDLIDRRISTIDILPAPSSEAFVSTNTPVPKEVAERSTWSPDCPVALDELAYLNLSFWGFDDAAHTGELIVNEGVADDVIAVFNRLFESRFPIEEMRVIAADELDLPPTGDGNNTTSFVCRQVTASQGWSQHAFGLAIDINPFQNPYQKGELVVPELASAYLDRSFVRPGMILPGDVATTEMTQIGWGWGGSWTTLTDTMHFSQNGR